MECHKCKKPAVYETERTDRTYGTKRKYCVGHFTEIWTKYEMKVKRIHGK